MVFFNNCDIRVNGTGVMAQNASITSQSPVIGMRTLGRNRAHVTAGGTYQNLLRFTYVINLDQDPCFASVTDLKNTKNFTGLSPETIEVAGITGSYYLQDYSIAVKPNEVAVASVSYVGYELVTGTIRNKSSNYNFIQSGFSGLAHSWTSKITSDDGDLEVPIYDFSYDLKVGLNPIYVLGKKFPTQVQLLTTEEEMLVVRDEYQALTWYGTSGCKLFDSCSNNPKVKVMKLANFCNENIDNGMIFDVSNSTFESAGINVDTNDFVSVNLAATRYY